MKLGWSTYGKTNTSCVQYGTDEQNLSSRACSDDQFIYDGSRMYFHTVDLTNLSPATKYFYRIESTNTTTGQFQSGRAPGDLSPFTINAVTDLGVYGEDGYTISESGQKSLIPRVLPSNNHTTIARLINTFDDYEFVIHPGDLGYADDWYLKPDNLFDGAAAYTSIIEQFYDQLAPVSGRKPYMASPGNHESSCREIGYLPGTCPEGQDNFADFRYRFGDSMPRASPSHSSNATAQSLANQAAAEALPPFWFSFEYGQVHVTFIDTETDFPNAPDEPGGSQHLGSGPFGRPGQQQKFLELDLASVDRNVTPWVIVAGHRPWYTTTDRGGCTECQAAFEETLYKYGVDLATFG